MSVSGAVSSAARAQPMRPTVKCVVWDLDNTLWKGTLLEDREVTICRDAVETVKLLDSRGILNSIASRNEHELAIRELNKFGITDYFLYPQINWNAKSSSIRAIAQALNLSEDSFAFIDDQAVERDEVRSACQGVLCLSDIDIARISQMPEFAPGSPCEDGSLRRKRYMADIQRQQAERDFEGPEEDFLRSLNMNLRISQASEADLDRVEELTVRTHQLNSTGRIYSREELRNYCNSLDHKVYVASFADRFGDYGKIGIALLECSASAWNLRLLLVSCRVLNRGIGTIFLRFLMHSARRNGVPFFSDLIPTDRNRIMYITFRLAGLVEHSNCEEMVVLRDSLELPAEIPDYLNLVVDEQR